MQLTPRGSGCSVQIGVGLTDAAPGSMRGVYAVVEDLEAVRAELAERGVPVGADPAQVSARELARRLETRP